MINIAFHAAEVGAALQVKAMVNILKKYSYSFSFETEGQAKRVLENKPKKNLDLADIAICGFDNIYKDKASRFIKEVREKGIPSIGILDSWKGIDRFFKDDLTLRDLTDVIILFDTFSKDYLVERGIPDHKLVLTGDFVLNELYLRLSLIHI